MDMLNKKIENAGLRSAIRSVFVPEACERRDHTWSKITGSLSALGCAGVLLASPAVAWAGPITYNINLITGINVTGTITTDGTTGDLAGSNFTGFDLHITYAPLQYDIAGTTVSCGAVCGVTATGSQLLFDPHTVDFHFSDPPVFLGLHSVFPNHIGYNISLSFPDPPTSGSVTVAATQPVIFGTAAAAVPEPGTIALSALAFAGLAAVRRRRQSQKTATAT